ncbi:hypothetical protein KEM54_002315, partial [Ascosphaera aggregata]
MTTTWDTNNNNNNNNTLPPRSSNTLAPPQNPFAPPPIPDDDSWHDDIEGNAGSSSSPRHRHYDGNDNNNNDDDHHHHHAQSPKSKKPPTTRWATQRIPPNHPAKKRVSVLDRLSRKGTIRSIASRRKSSVAEGGPYGNGMDESGADRDEKRKSSWSTSWKQKKSPNLSNENDSSNAAGGFPFAREDDSSSSSSSTSQGRTIYFNLPLPPEMFDDEGQMKVTYARNKIRTAKYTPLSFVPKNLWFQFHNVANIYFLFIIILNFFPIFGATNPGLNAVPLIAIIAITAIKDAIEDWRRTVLDNELNNSPVHRLQEWNNVNSSVDNVGPWRRFKKACTRATVTTYRFIKAMTTKQGRQEREERKEKERERAARGRSSVEFDPRVSIATNRASIADFDVAATRGRSQSFVALGQGRGSSSDEVMEGGTAMEMTPVPSPNPDVSRQYSSSQYLAPEDALKQPTSTDASSIASSSVSREYGSIINPRIHGPGTARFARDAWKNVQVGDFVRIYSDEQVPADIVILATSDPDGGCYVETKNLDGETNLKVRQALRCGAE